MRLTAGTVGKVIAYRHETDTYDMIVCKDAGARLELHIAPLCGKTLTGGLVEVVGLTSDQYLLCGEEVTEEPETFLP